MRFDEQQDGAPRQIRHRVRAIFLSDVHLGTQVSKSDRLLDFLRHHDAQSIYLVGDIVDGWRLRSRWHWPKTHSEVIGELFAAAQRGTRVRLSAGQSRCVPARLSRHPFRRHRSRGSGHSCRRRRASLCGHAWRPARSHDAAAAPDRGLRRASQCPPVRLQRWLEQTSCSRSVCPAGRCRNGRGIG